MCNKVLDGAFEKTTISVVHIFLPHSLSIIYVSFLTLVLHLITEAICASAIKIGAYRVSGERFSSLLWKKPSERFVISITILVKLRELSAGRQVLCISVRCRTLFGRCTLMISPKQLHTSKPSSTGSSASKSLAYPSSWSQLFGLRMSGVAVVRKYLSDQRNPQIVETNNNYPIKLFVRGEWKKYRTQPESILIHEFVDAETISILKK